MRKQSIRRGVLYIGERKKQQTGGLFPFVTSLARPALGGLAGPILKKII